MVIALLASVALGGTLITSASVGNETAVYQQWAGAELTWRPSEDVPLHPLARLTLGAGKGPSPTASLDLGLLARVPEDEAIVRVGLVARAIVDHDAFPYPVSLSGGDLRWGLVPALLGHLEFEWEGPAPYGVGVQAGMGSRPTDALCTADVLLHGCLRWLNGFHGGFFVWKRWEPGLTVELTAGIAPRMSVGWAW